MQQYYRGSRFFLLLTILSLLLAIGLALYCTDQVYAHLPINAYSWMLGWLFLALIFSLASYQEFVIGFLSSLFCMMIGWRIAALYDIHLLMILLSVTFLFFIMNFIYCIRAYSNAEENNSLTLSVMNSNWQVLFLRLYLGLNFIPHFTEKLFAGSAPYMIDVHGFTSLGVPHPELFVILAGLCEFGAAITLTFGLFLRLGAFCAVLYLFIATYLGHHFSLGFIWAGPGGGWEFATMWMMLIFSFCLARTHQFSFDQRIKEMLIKKLS